MDLTWWLVAIVGCLLLAVCIVAAFFRPLADTRAFRPLANVERITKLPAYVRAMRRRTLAGLLAIALLALGFGCAVVVGARPTGLPTAARDAGTAQPEDVMVCAGAPSDDPALTATMRFFAGTVTSFDTARIGLTSANRRVIPLTRDHQYAAQRFGEYAQPVPANQQTAREFDFAPAAKYSDYTETVDDLLALCLTGFPDFEQSGSQRRSLIYVGPGELGTPSAQRPALYGADPLRMLAEQAGVQVNVLVTGPGSQRLDELARATGGMTFAAESGVAAQLSDVRAHPPPANPEVELTVATTVPESPDLPVVAALLAISALSLAAMVVRR